MPDFEREKWEADVRLREREIAIKEKESAANIRHIQRTRWWSDPLVLAVLAATVAAVGNAAAALINGVEQRALDERHASAEATLQAAKSLADRQLEETKAEAGRILEVIKTNDPDKAATNLAFLLETGLITSDERRKDLAAYLKTRKVGEGPALPAVSSSNSPSFLPAGPKCALKDGRDADFAYEAVRKALDGLSSEGITYKLFPPVGGLTDNTAGIAVYIPDNQSQSHQLGAMLLFATAPDHRVVITSPNFPNSSLGNQVRSVVKATFRSLAEDPRCPGDP